MRFNDRIMLPYEPFIGTLGVSPQIEAVLSLQPDYWGGNMDLPDVAPGAILYFPVQTKGAYLFLGDCHGRQGDGEFCGVAVEINSTTTIQVDLIKQWTIGWPRLENAEFLMAIGSARPMEDAARIAYRELIRWLVADYGFEELEAYFLLTQAGKTAGRQHGRPQIHAGRLPSQRLSAESLRSIAMDLGLKGLKAVVTGGTKGIGRRVADTARRRRRRRRDLRAQRRRGRRDRRPR